MPVEAQVELVPPGFTGIKVPLVTEPFTSYEYQISFKAPEEQPIVAV